MANLLQLPSLGRPFNLGMLYDCRTEKLIPGITLWGSQKLKSASQVEKQPSCTCKVIAEDSIQEKSSTLGVDANLKLSLMCGLVSVEGAANYLNDQKSSKKQSRVTLQYTSTTHFVQLTMDQIGDIEFPDVLDDRDATHVVTGIQYGADAFFVFDRSIEGAEKMDDVHGKMEASVKCIPNLTVSGGGSVSYKNVDKTETDKFHCTFHGDLILSSNPSSFDEAIKLYKELPQLITENGSVPKLVYLSPLTKLKKVGSQQIISAISFEVTSQVEKLMEQFHDTEMRISDLLNHVICAKFVDLKSQLKKLKDLLTRYKMSFVKDLAQILPKVRSAGEKEEKLAELISSVHASPFSSSAIGKHLCDKEKEINYLAQCLKNVEKESKIQFDFPSTDCNLAELKFDFEIDQVVCFGFNVTSDTSPYIQTLERYLQTGEVEQIEQQEWFNTEVAKQVRSKLIQFIEFTKANASKKTISYVVTNADSETTERRPSLILYSSGVSMPFDPPGKPGTPEASNVTAKRVDLKWTAPRQGGNVLLYRVVYRSTKASSATKELKTHSTSLTIPGLAPAVAYDCQVFAVGDCDCILASEPCHFETQECTKEVTLAGKFLSYSQSVEPKAVVPIYKLPLKLIIEDKANKLRKYEIVLPNTPLNVYTKPEKVLMVLGATGAGKSTLINGMANYILGVTWEDDFRYKVITDEGSRSQAFSQTKYITAYSFRSTKMHYNLTVVDTPGFGDTGGIENDRKIEEQIKIFFSGIRDTCSIDILHGIGFVTQASLARLTATQRFIFTSILAIFGKDISDNIFLMTTFADANTPPVLEAVKQAKIPYSSSFKFNNSALYADNKSSQSTFDSMFWVMGYTSFCDFFNHFSQAEAKSLALTREVLEEREILETLIPILQEQVRIGMSQMDEIRQEEAILKQHETDLNANKDFVYEIEVTAFRKVDLKPGIHTTTCQTCNYTCHKSCAYANDADKQRCCAMKGTEDCTVCPKKCHWSQHSNVPYIFEYYKKQETRTSDDLKRKYDSAVSGKESVEAMIAKNEDNLVALHVEVHMLIEKTHKSIERLQQIALKPNPLTEVDYLDLLIESEQQEAKYGWQARVKQLQEFRKDAELYQKVASGQFDSLGAIVQYDQRPSLLKRVQQYWKSQQAVRSPSLWSRLFGGRHSPQK